MPGEDGEQRIGTRRHGMWNPARMEDERSRWLHCGLLASLPQSRARDDEIEFDRRMNVSGIERLRCHKRQPEQQAIVMQKAARAGDLGEGDGGGKPGPAWIVRIGIGPGERRRDAFDGVRDIALGTGAAKDQRVLQMIASRQSRWVRARQWPCIRVGQPEQGIDFAARRFSLVLPSIEALQYELSAGFGISGECLMIRQIS